MTEKIGVNLVIMIQITQESNSHYGKTSANKRQQSF